MAYERSGDNLNGKPKRRLNAGKNKKRKLTPIQKLTRKFRKNGLNFIEARYNALCVYYTYKSSKKRRELCGEFSAVDSHPLSWSYDRDNFSVYRKNKYDVRLEILYFLAGIFKYLAAYNSALRNIKSSVRAVFRKTKKRKHKLKILKRGLANAVHFLIPALAVITVFFTIRYINAYDVGIKVSIDGEYFGIAKNIGDVEDIKTMVEKDMSSVMNFSYSFNHAIEYILVPVKKTEYLTQDKIYGKLYSLASDNLINAYGLYIDGKLIGAAASKDELANTLKAVLDEEKTADDEKFEYANDIQIIEQQYLKDLLMNPEVIKTMLESSVQTSGPSENIIAPDETEEAVQAFAASAFTEEAAGSAKLTNTGDANTDYSPTIGESMLDSHMNSAVSAALTEAGKSNSISRGVADAVKNNMSKKIYASINNEAVLGNITSDSEGYYSSELVLKKIKKETYNETIPFTVEYRDSDKDFIGTEVTLSEGEDGINYVMDSVTYIGSEEVERVRMATLTLKYPKNKIVLRGTKQKPKAAPTGNFIKPVKALYIASEFNITGDGDSYHRGIDYVANHGEPIYASDGGTVLFAGEGTPWSYGIYVKLMHANGIATVYAHMSETTVKTGDKVYQGQVIGKVGSTGNSFGAHLHFEMLINGSLINPETKLK